jgi:hypothetical protein
MFVCIEYRCADGRFWLSTRGVTILNSLSSSSSKTEIRNGINSWWKAHLLSSSAERQEAIGGLWFSKKWSPATIQSALELENLERPPYQLDISACSFLAGQFVFQRWWSKYSEIGRQELPDSTKLASYLDKFFPICTSMVYVCVCLSRIARRMTDGRCERSRKYRVL